MEGTFLQSLISERLLQKSRLWHVVLYAEVAAIDLVGWMQSWLPYCSPWESHVQPTVECCNAVVPLCIRPGGDVQVTKVKLAQKQREGIAEARSGRRSPVRPNTAVSCCAGYKCLPGLALKAEQQPNYDILAGPSLGRPFSAWRW